jgi:hypothetical protein
MKCNLRFISIPMNTFDTGQYRKALCRRWNLPSVTISDKGIRALSLHLTHNRVKYKNFCVEFELLIAMVMKVLYSGI